MSAPRIDVPEYLLARAADGMLMAPAGDGCVLHASHSPKPLRIVVHHVFPQECGGQTEPSNLAAVCDTGHYNTHRLMWLYLQKAGITTRAQLSAFRWPTGIGTKTERALAVEGYKQAIDAGTTNLVPHE